MVLVLSFFLIAPKRGDVSLLVDGGAIFPFASAFPDVYTSFDLGFPVVSVPADVDIDSLEDKFAGAVIYT